MDSEPSAGTEAPRSPQLSLLRIIGFAYYAFAVIGGLSLLAVVGFQVSLLYSLSSTPAVPTATTTGPTVVTTTMTGSPLGDGILGLGFTVLVAGTVIVLQWLLADSLLKQKRYYYCLIVSFLMLISIPVGTILGLITIVLLFQKEVKRQFARSGPGQAL